VKSVLQNNTLPLKVHLTGGVDSMLVYSIIESVTNDYEFIFENRYQWDYFWCCNFKVIQKHWSYTQVHHYIEPTFLASGAVGDSFMLRHPIVVALWLKFHDIDLCDFEFPKGTESNLISHIQNRIAKSTVINDYYEQIQGLTHNEFKLFVLNIIVNDFQHWHIGNTYTFTPLKDLNIANIMLNLKVEDSLGQLSHSEISKSIISNNNSDLIKYLHKAKGDEFCPEFYKFVGKNRTG
jgi:hypothetical protein